MQIQSRKILDKKIPKDQRAQLLLPKAGSKSRVLGMPSAHKTTKGEGKPTQATLPS